MSFDEIKELFKATMRSIKDFVPIESEDDKAIPKLEEARSLKRDAKEEIDQGRLGLCLISQKSAKNKGCLDSGLLTISSLEKLLAKLIHGILTSLDSSQDKYVADILKKFDFFSVKTTSTLMETNKALLKDEEVVDIDVHLYRSVVGSLMYLTASRHDIMFAVCTYARFQVTPKVSHLYAVKRIFRYLKGQPKLGLWYPRDSPFDLKAFSDSDYARASLDMKSITRAEGEGSGHPSEPQPPPFTAQPTHEDPIPIIASFSHQNTQTPSITLKELTVICTTLSQKVESLEANLKQTKQVYGAIYTKLIIKVKELEKIVKTSKARRKAKIVVSDDEEEFNDPSKQGRSMIEEINQDIEVTLVTPTQTYTRRRTVSIGSGGVSTASRMISIAKELVNIAGTSMPVTTAGMVDKGKGIMKESESDVTKTKRPSYW
nr:uncharacterized mitochondrial protein AtMg00810-like [Tanacetum cinerariifolium]